MLANIKKNDRVMTIGGIVGSVVSASDAEVSLKVDESANVKITVIRSDADPGLVVDAELAPAVHKTSQVVISKGITAATALLKQAEAQQTTAAA